MPRSKAPPIRRSLWSVGWHHSNDGNWSAARSRKAFQRERGHMTSESSRGLVHLKSPYSVFETMARLQDAIRSKGIPILARIDHSGDALRAGLQMNPAQLLIFGNARAGTPLMVASPTIAIDLPLKALVWQDADGAVWLTYNSPEYLLQRHSLPLDLAQNIAAIKAVSEEAVKR